MSKSKKPSVDRAVATIRQPSGTDALKASCTATVTQAMKASPNWAAATDVQSAVAVWTKDATALAANATTIANLRAQLATAEALQLTLRRDWSASRQQVISTVTVFCGGSADKVKGFNLDVVTHARIGTLAVPTALTVNPGKVLGEVVAKWARGLAKHGFVVEHATDPSNAATISAPTVVTKISFKLEGMTQGANVSFRVAAVDPASPTGQTGWTTWVIGSAR
jgi:hypothetical protein